MPTFFDTTCPTKSTERLSRMLSRCDFHHHFQKIVLHDGNIIGYEILLDFPKARENITNGFTLYSKALDDGSALDCLLDKLLECDTVLPGKKLFINVERIEICKDYYLRKVVTTAKHLHMYCDVQLVVEVTERNSQLFCIKGLTYLKESSVALAIDDFDIYNHDVRIDELNTGLYDYIKLVMPKSPAEGIILNEFVEARNEKIILEMVEDKYLLRAFNISMNIHAYQGYAYK